MRKRLSVQSLRVLGFVGAKSAWVLAAGALLLPAILVFYSLVMASELEQMKVVFLRNRAANIAARLETLAPVRADAGLIDVLAAEEPGIADIEIYDAPSADPALESIWRGRELYRTVRTGGVFRVYIPFHAENRMHVARIDLAEESADFLVRHARQNVAAAAIAGLALMLLGIYGIWSARRRMRLEALARLGRLSAVLAHEIRNPLGTIKGFTQLACEQAPPEIAGLLEPALAEVRRLEQLVTDLLLFGRDQSPQERLVRWSDVTRSLSAEPRLVAAGEDFSFRTDPDLLKQVLLNLVRNSLEAQGQKGGPVRLTASRQPGKVTIAVEDDGPGFPEHIRANRFEPFRTTKANGAGLGLSISRKLVETLGGRLQLANLAPRGARAEITLHGYDSGN